MWTRSLALTLLVGSIALGCGNRTDVSASPAGTSSDEGSPSDATATDGGATSDATATDGGTTPDATAMSGGEGACGGDASVRTFDAACPLIRASDYDQSCTTDHDCVEVGEGDACDLGCGFSCGGKAINRCDLARYQADVAAARHQADLDAAGFTFTANANYPSCNCPADFGACCRAGRCVDDYCCLNTCSDAGGGGPPTGGRFTGGQRVAPR